jgi:hypothetical protein
MIFQNWFRGDLSCFIKFRGSKIHFHRLGADVLQPSYVGGEVYFFLECMNVQPESLSLEHMLVDDIREVFSLWLSRWNLFLATRAHSLLIKFEFRKSLAGQKPKSRFLPRYHTNIGPNRPPLLSLSLFPGLNLQLALFQPTPGTLSFSCSGKCDMCLGGNLNPFGRGISGIQGLNSFVAFILSTEYNETDKLTASWTQQCPVPSFPYMIIAVFIQRLMRMYELLFQIVCWIDTCQEFARAARSTMAVAVWRLTDTWALPTWLWALK